MERIQVSQAPSQPPPHHSLDNRVITVIWFQSPVYIWACDRHSWYQQSLLLGLSQGLEEIVERKEHIKNVFVCVEVGVACSRFKKEMW